MNFASIKGVTLHYRIDGPSAAPPLVLVNSLGTDARIWDDFIAMLAGRYCVMSYDKRGHGLSDAVSGPYRLEDHLDDLFGLADFLGIGDFALAGVSVGGLIAQGAAVRHGARVRALVLCHTAAKIGTASFWDDRIRAVMAGGTIAIADSVMERWFEDEAEANEMDFVLNRIMDVRRRKTLIAARSDADGKAVYTFDIRLQGGDETVFFDI
ncbi:alpha/beta fold hydrolase [Mesorhizobium sp. LMG17149]|uniref:alpha/beta fold hydrolase n=1 Tax=Mesorhizobium sp. LMG17149 TaxID=2968497 RepID=UPI002118360F|nr:alpha/beta fold hydrolase [Mesorhizobium sp. LMG17149]MCQ8871773.1 alpha/beta fold hydrolase [Mesorhizobium sp. LMG17149]